MKQLSRDDVPLLFGQIKVAISVAYLVVYNFGDCATQSNLMSLATSSIIFLLNLLGPNLFLLS